MLAGNLKTNNFKGDSICQIVVVVAADTGMGMELVDRSRKVGNWWRLWRRPMAAPCGSGRSPMAALRQIARGAALHLY